MSVAVNDQHGIIDCFGFYQLGVHDFNKICERFHEESSKIKAPLGYCLRKLDHAERLSLAQRYRIPYEYSCWKPMLGDVEADTTDWYGVIAPLAKSGWGAMTVNLYQHPDFITWFLEEDDHAAVGESMARLSHALENPDPDTFLSTLNTEAETLGKTLLSSPWRSVFRDRLVESAYLLNLQDIHTFAALAATEAKKLTDGKPGDAPTGFSLQFARRTLEEALLRQSQEGRIPATLEKPVEDLLAAWNVE